MPPLITILPYYSNGTNVSPVTPPAGPVGPTVGGVNSTEFNNTGRVTVPHDGSFDFGTGDYTIEFWVRQTGNDSSDRILDLNFDTNTIFRFYMSSGSSSRYLRAHIFGNTVNLVRNTASRLAANTWHHIAVTRENGSLKFFHNGQRQITTSDATNWTHTPGNVISIGAAPAGGNEFSGQVSNLRIVKGEAVYTTDFTVPNKALVQVTGTELLAFTSGTEVNESTNKTLTTIGTVTASTEQPAITTRDAFGSINFDGSTHAYLSSGTVDAPGTADFTLEFFIRVSTVNQYTLNKGVILDYRGAGQVNGMVITMGGFFGSTADALRVRYNTDLTLVGTTVLSDDKWHHCSITRTGNTIRLFIDGNVEATGTNSSPVSIGAQRPAIGGNGFEINGNSIGNNPVYFEGKLSSLRLVGGKSLYTANFTAPKLPLSLRSDRDIMAFTSGTNADSLVAGQTFTVVGAGAPNTDHPFVVVTPATTSWTLGTTQTGASAGLLLKDTVDQTQDYVIECELVGLYSVPNCGLGIYPSGSTSVTGDPDSIRVSYQGHVYVGSTQVVSNLDQGIVGDKCSMEVRFSNATTAQIKFFYKGALVHTENNFDMSGKKNTLWAVGSQDACQVKAFNLL